MTNDVDIFMFLLAIYISSSVKCIIQTFCLFKKCYLFSNWVEKVKWVKSFSRVRLFATPWTVAYQTLPIVGFSRQEYWSGCHFLLQGIFPTQGSNLGLPHCRQTLYPLSHQEIASDKKLSKSFSPPPSPSLLIPSHHHQPHTLHTAFCQELEKIWKLLL